MAESLLPEVKATSHHINYSKVQFDKTELATVNLNHIIGQIVDDLALMIVERVAMLEYAACDHGR